MQNEPHTRDLYEKNRGLEPGQLVKNWLGEMSAWLKGLDSNHLISSGEEGYRADGDTGSVDGVTSNGWINGGYKGWGCCTALLHAALLFFCMLHCSSACCTALLHAV